MATEKQLPFGQITPVAKPLGSFITPGQKQTAGAAKPSLIGSVPQIATLQRGSQGNVQGYNQFQQLSEALGPFTQNLVKAGAAVYENYARTNMEIGRKNTPEYLQARNELEKAKLSLQVQQEKGLADSMSAIDVLRKTDPDAAALLEVTNPWRLTGRRKFLSQMMAAEVDNKFEDYIANNQLELSKLPTDHPQIAKAQHQIITKLQDKYGLTGDEPEYARYVIGAENKARDSFRDTHETIYHEAIDISTVETAVASTFKELNSKLKDGLQTYITDPENGQVTQGEVITQGHEQFSYLLGQHMTAHLDDKLKLLGGERRQKALKKIYEEVVAFYSNDELAINAIKQIRSGSQLDEFDKRPYLFETMPVKLLEMQNEGLEEQTKAIELEEKQKKQTLDRRWYGKGGPGRFRPDTKEYKDSIKEFYNGALAINYRDIEKYIADRNKNLETITSLFNKPTAKERSDYRRKLSTLTREEIEGKYQEIFEELQGHALPMNDGGKYLNKLTQILDDREEYLARRPDSIEDQLYRRLPEIMDDPRITPKGLKGGIFGSYSDQLNASLDQKGKKFSNKIITQILKSADKKADEWLRDNDARVVPENVGENLLDQAFDEYTASPEYKELYEKNFPAKKEKVNIDPKQIKKDSRNQPVGLVGSENVPDRVVKKYRERAVLNATWLHNELENLRQQKELSPQLKQFATRAKTSPERYLLEQLRFWRSLDGVYTFDPDGSVRKYLEGLVNNKKSTDQASLTYFNKAMASAISPGPGDWMLNMLFGGPVNAEPMPTATGLTTGDNNQRFQAAVALAKKLGAKYPEVVAAQFALESDFGRDPSGTNNLFGLKALPGTKGSLVNTEEDDASGKSKKVKANFINFDSEEKSFKYLIDKWYKDYKSFTGVESGKSIKEVTNLLQQQGYATDPNYAKTLQTLVQEYSIGG
jgi:hypothetical protein